MTRSSPLVIVVGCLVVALTGCGATDVPAVPGCSDVRIDHQDLGGRFVLSISARECRVVDGRGQGLLLSADRVIDVLAESAWRAKAPRFDDVFATVYRAAEEPRFVVGYSRQFSRDELTARWGSRPAVLDTRPPPEHDSVWPWVLVLLGGLAYVAVMVGLVRALRTGRVVMLWLR